MKIAIGSKNPVKIEATRIAFSKVFKNQKIEVVGVKVSSGVREMPLSFPEAIKGAKSRAKQAIEATGADFGVGLEGGFEKEALGTFLSGCAAIVNKQGRWGYAKGAGFYIPEWIVCKVKNEGKELGTVMDEILGTKGIKRKEGTTGFLTKNLVSRTHGFTRTLIYALSRFMREEVYEKK